MTEKCPHCSFDPTSASDYCEKHRPLPGFSMSNAECQQEMKELVKFFRGEGSQYVGATAT